MPTRINGSEAAATPAKLAPLSVNNHATAAAASGEKNANQKNKKAVNGSGSNRSEKPTKSSTPRRRKHRGRRPTSPIKKDEFGRSASARRPDPPKKSGGSNPVPRSSSAPRRKEANGTDTIPPPPPIPKKKNTAAGHYGPSRQPRKILNVVGGNVSRSTSEPMLADQAETLSSTANGHSNGRSIPPSRAASTPTKPRRLRHASSGRRSRKGKAEQPTSSSAKESLAASLLISEPAAVGRGRRRKISGGGGEVREPVFALDVRTQRSRLVTDRQRKEIYALNRLMTKLENERFRQFCQEKGHRGDFSGTADGAYDLFL